MKKKYAVIGGLLMASMLSAVFIFNAAFSQNMPSWFVEKQKVMQEHDKLEKQNEERANKLKDSDRPKLNEKVLKDIEADIPEFPEPYVIEEITKPGEQVPLFGNIAAGYVFSTSAKTPYNWVFTGNIKEKPDDGFIMNIYARPKTGERNTYYYTLPGTGKITLTSIDKDKKVLTFKTEKGQSGTFDVSSKEGKYTIK